MSELCHQTGALNLVQITASKIKFSNINLEAVIWECFWHLEETQPFLKPQPPKN